MEDHDTGFHDHDLCSGAVAVARGAVIEDRLRLGGGASSRTVHAGSSFAFAASDIHRVRHDGRTAIAFQHALLPMLGFSVLSLLQVTRLRFAPGLSRPRRAPRAGRVQPAVPASGRSSSA